jgi:hypothetical protein
LLRPDLSVVASSNSSDTERVTDSMRLILSRRSR